MSNEKISLYFISIKENSGKGNGLYKISKDDYFSCMDDMKSKNNDKIFIEFTILDSNSNEYKYYVPKYNVLYLWEKNTKK